MSVYTYALRYAALRYAALRIANILFAWRSERVLSVSVATNACVGRPPGGCRGGLGGVYRSPAGACAAVSAAGGIPSDFTQLHPRSPQLAAWRATACDESSHRPRRRQHPQHLTLGVARDNITITLPRLGIALM
ncbi:unnamed protein product [Colias eurytheme]|nr:unnamed protein product [Colias eurytheme]